ncbi:MAG: hypothetical protein IT189_07385 [Microbacteriaceae bacterium]|nr:hypothetical protein [Microbacteriaceae bacterium]
MSEKITSTIRARFYVAEVKKTAAFSGVNVVLLPVVRPTDDNIDWSKFTPSGKFEMNVTNEGAAATLEAALRKDVLITIEVVEPAE